MTRHSPSVPVPPTPAPKPITTTVNWDFPTSSNVTLFDLIAKRGSPSQSIIAKDVIVEGNSTNTNSGAKVPAVWAQRRGRYYFEITCNILASTSGGISIGVVDTSYVNLTVESGLKFPTGGATLNLADGDIFANGQNNQTFINVGEDDIVGVAVDLDASLVWFKVVSGPDVNFDPDWNGGATGSDGGSFAGSNPTGRVLGMSIPSGLMVPFALVNVANSATQQMVLTANFGATPFAIGNSIPIFYETWPPLPAI